MKRIIMGMALVAATATFGVADASVLVAYAQDFDSLGTGNRSIPGTGAIGAQGIIAGLDGKWVATRIDGTGTSPLSAFASDGTASSGGIVNYGASGGTDRSLGSVASGTTVTGFGLLLVNSSGFRATSISIAFDARQFRSSTLTRNVLAFAYGFGGGGIATGDFLSSAQMTALAAGDVVGAQPAGSGAAVIPPLTTPVSFTIGNIAWESGQTLFLRWQDSNEPGNDGGLAVDNFVLSAVPAPGAVSLLGLAAAVASRRRR